MDVHTDAHVTRGDTSPNPLAERTHKDQEHEPRDAALSEDLVQDSLTLPSPNVHLSPATDDGDIEAHEGQGSIHVSKSDRELSDIHTEKSNKIDLDHESTNPQSNPDQDILPAMIEKVSPSECAVVPTVEPTSLTDIDDAEAAVMLLRAVPVSSSTPPRDEEEASPGDRLNSNQTLHTEPDHVEAAGCAHMADDEETREDFNDDFLPSLPPSSSPPQLFSSSPYVSSQSSDGDAEPSKMTLAVDPEGCAYGGAQSDHVVSVRQDEPPSRSEDLHSHERAKVATSLDTDELCPQMGPTLCDERGTEHSRKRIADPDEPYNSQPTKRPKLDLCFYVPPAPKRATLASQHHQYKKLAAPFRPPLKLPTVAERPAQVTNNGRVETTISTTLETSHDRNDPKRSMISLQHKASNTSRSAAQFKSPLVNRILPADARTIRLTPALQALERKLQLLKRAIKVKQDSEEEVLTRLAEKWIEAGREVAYDVWDATKDSGEFMEKATSFRRSHGWQSTEGGTPWGWDTKPGDASEESRDTEPPEACASGRAAPEEVDVDVGCKTLGNMLRQLGVAPEIFGWDDDKEAFAD